MTKKSAGRLARDAAEEAAKQELKSTCWDDLTAVYHACSFALDNAANKINSLFAMPGVKENLVNKGEVAIAIRGLVDDRRALRTSLDEIYAKHKQKAGGSDDTTNLDLESLQVGEEYEMWEYRLKSTYLPNIEYLVSEVSQAIERGAKAAALQDLQDQATKASEPVAA